MVKPTNGKLRLKIQRCVYAVTKKDVDASNTMVTDTFCLFSYDARVLTNLESTHSLISDSFSKHFDVTLEPIEYELVISTPLDKTTIADLVYK